MAFILIRFNQSNQNTAIQKYGDINEFEVENIEGKKILNDVALFFIYY